MDNKKGLYNKYKVERTDGKFDGRVYLGRGDDPAFETPADYFVLKLNSGNAYELDALEAYAKSCKKDLPLLAGDLFEKVLKYRKRL